MTPKELISILTVAERLKCATRHCYTSTGRQESVAEHSWRIALMGMLLKPEFPELDMDRVIRMCLIHDLGEAFTGDIPTFLKTEADSEKEDQLFSRWVATLPAETSREFSELLEEEGLTGKQKDDVLALILRFLSCYENGTLSDEAESIMEDPSYETMLEALETHNYGPWIRKTLEHPPRNATRLSFEWD